MTPGRKALTQELRAVVGTQHIRQSPGRFQLLEHANQAHTGQRGIDLDGQGLPVEVIQHMEGPKPHAVVQRITHEVGRPDLIRARWHH